VTQKRVLFLCTSNRCRSQMAEALINHDLGDRYQAFSAGTAPKTPHPLALKVLAELGIEHKGARSKHMDQFARETFDYVITLCDTANETCPIFFGGTKRTHIGFDDPDKASGTEEEILGVFRRVRDEIRMRIEEYLTEEDDRKGRP
jgi:arsenate reductase (thioredoxin)